MTLVDSLNACLASLKHSVNRNDAEETRGLCRNLNCMLSTIYDYNPHSKYHAYSSLKIGVQVDHRISEQPDDVEVYRPNVQFWRRMYTDYGETVPFKFDILQPALSADEENESTNADTYKYHVEFVCVAPHKVECRIYISERQHTIQAGDDIALPEFEPPCLILYPHEITGFAENGPRNVTTFLIPESQRN